MYSPEKLKPGEMHGGSVIRGAIEAFFLDYRADDGALFQTVCPTLAGCMSELAKWREKHDAENEVRENG